MARRAACRLARSGPWCPALGSTVGQAVPSASWGKEMSTSTITSKGQATIPKRIREFLKVKAGDQLDFVIADDGRVLVRPGTVGVV